MKKEIAKTRFVIVAVLLFATALLLQARGRVEVQPNYTDLENLPFSIGPWQGTSTPIGQDIREILGDGQFLSRYYASPKIAPVDLFIAYYSTQRSGDTIHSPKNCLPGSGWTPLEADRVWVNLGPQTSIRVNRYIIAKGLQRQLVMYWYQAHGHVTASEYMAKLYLVSDSIKMNRSDGGMVRLVTPMLPDETVEQSQERATEFARVLYPMLDSYIPR